MKTQYRIVVGLLLLTLFLAVGTYLRWWNLRIPVGQFVVSHWVSLIGGGYLLVAVPAYAILKRRIPQYRGALLKVHVFGNLVAFALIAIHFANHLGRVPLPDLGTGLTSAIVVVIIVATGFLQRFGLMAGQRTAWRVIHVGLAFVMFAIIIVHTLRNFGLL
jgi:hypothetical protein